MTIKIHALNTVSMDIVGLEQIYLNGGSFWQELREGRVVANVPPASENVVLDKFIADYIAKFGDS